MKGRGFTLIEVMIAIGIIGIIILWLSLTIAIFRGCSEVKTNGLKSVIENVWEGDKSKTNNGLEVTEEAEASQQKPVAAPQP